MVAEAVTAIVFMLAVVRGCLRIRVEGWGKLALVLFVAIGSSVVGASRAVGPLIQLVLAVLCLLVLTRPSRLSRLIRRWQKVVASLADGLGLPLAAGIIPIEQIRDGLQAHGQKGNSAEEVINACSCMVEGRALVLATPAAAALPPDEAAFIAAHEIGHHVLGHTRAGLLATISQALGSLFGQIVTFGIGSIWKYLIVPRHSQTHEFAADEWAVRRLRQCGLDPAKGAALFDRFSQLESDAFAYRIRTKLFGSHPPSADRKARVLTLIDH